MTDMREPGSVRWLAECSVEAVRAALRSVAPELSGQPISLPDQAGKHDPVWWKSSAVAGGRFLAKFAWSRPAALHVAHEIGVLTALAADPGFPFLPEVVACGTDPLILVTRLVPGASLFEVADSIDRDRAGAQLAGFLAALARPDHRTPPEWVEDLSERFAALGIDP